jgi:hypothetical protein
MSSNPPPHVAQAAKVVEQWLDSAPAVVSDAEYNAMTPGQKWDYARSHDQSQFRAPDVPTRSKT